MQFLSFDFIILVLQVAFELAMPQPAPNNAFIDDFIRKVTPIARQGLLNNTGRALGGAVSNVYIPLRRIPLLTSLISSLAPLP